MGLRRLLGEQVERLLISLDGTPKTVLEVLVVSAPLDTLGDAAIGGVVVAMLGFALTTRIHRLCLGGDRA